MQNDFSNRSVAVGGSVYGGVIAGDGNIQNSPTEQTIAVEKVVEEILNQLSQRYPNAPEHQKQIVFQMELQQKLKENPTLSDRILSSAKAGGFELVKVLTDNPFITVPLETFKGWIEAEAH